MTKQIRPGFQFLARSITLNSFQWSIIGNTLHNDELKLTLWISATSSLAGFIINGKTFFPFSEKQSIHILKAVDSAFPESKSAFSTNITPYHFSITPLRDLFSQTVLVSSNYENVIRLDASASVEVVKPILSHKTTPTFLSADSGLRIIKKKNGSPIVLTKPIPVHHDFFVPTTKIIFKSTTKTTINQTLSDVNVFGRIPFNYQPKFASELLNTICLKVYNLFQFGSFTRPSFLPAVA